MSCLLFGARQGCSSVEPSIKKRVGLEEPQYLLASKSCSFTLEFERQGDEEGEGGEKLNEGSRDI